MQLLLSTFAVIIAAAIVAIHILSVLFSDRRSIALNFINISLHIALVFVLLFNGAALEVLALAFMTSLLVYTAAFAMKQKAKGKEDSE